MKADHLEKHEIQIFRLQNTNNHRDSINNSNYYSFKMKTIFNIGLFGSAILTISILVYLIWLEVEYKKKMNNAERMACHPYAVVKNLDNDFVPKIGDRIYCADGVVRNIK